MKWLVFLCFVATVQATPLVKAGHPMNFSLSLPGAAEPKGYYASLLRCIELRSGLEFEWKGYPSTRLFYLLDNAELDLVYPVLFDSDRDKHYVRSVEFVSVNNVWLTLPERQLNLADKTITIVVKRGSLQAHYLEDAGYQNLVYVEEYNNQLAVLNAKRVDAALVPDQSLAAALTDNSPSYRKQLFNNAPGGFYLTPSFAKQHLGNINQAIQHCQQQIPKPAQPD
jgi:ABC-type amino acid transport substrate-binding protein